ncbi:aspartate ammonia-lyase, partial [Streptomyces sp. SID5910]|nr:aspartate ammonia-lyase [Streptomyces sp. SID5910]
VTALSPALGHENASAIALEAHRSGRPPLDLVRERGLLTEAQIRDLTSPASLTGLPAL